MVFSSSRNLKTFCCVPLQFQIELQGTGPSCPLGISDRRRQWHPTPALLPGKSHGRRILVGCSPQSCKKLDMTEVTQHTQTQYTAEEREGPLHFYFILKCIKLQLVTILCQFQVYSFRFFSIIGYYKTLNIVLCALQQVLVHLFCIQWSIFINPILLIYRCPSFPFW